MDKGKIDKLPLCLCNGAIVLLDGQRKKVNSYISHKPQGHPHGPSIITQVIFEDGERVSDTKRIQPVTGKLPDGFAIGEEIKYKNDKAWIRDYYFRRFPEDSEDRLIAILEVPIKPDNVFTARVDAYYIPELFHFPNCYEEISKRNAKALDQVLKTVPKPVFKRRNPKPSR